MLKKNINIGIIGLGQIGSRLFKEIKFKKKDIFIKTGKNVNIIAISAKNIKKKRNFKFNRDIFFKNPLDIANDPRIDIVIELIGFADGISKKVVATSLKNKKHIITANKALIAKNGDYLSLLAETNKVNLSPDLLNSKINFLTSKGFEVDYLTSCNEESFDESFDITDKNLLLAVAAKINNIRLIDNIVLTKL